MTSTSVTRDPLATRAHLVQSALDTLVDEGYSRTTGVEVCRRAGVTRGALNHHYPDFTDLLVAALEEAYGRMLEPARADAGSVSLEGWVRLAHQRTSTPEMKAVIELWLAARNDPAVGDKLAAAIEQGSALFRPERRIGADDPERIRFMRTVMETLIGLALGRAVLGAPLAHEASTVDHLASLARPLDSPSACETTG